MRYMSKTEWAAATKQITEKTPAELKELLKGVMGLETRRIEGQERRELMVMFALMAPIGDSNNQRFITEEYVIGGKTYNVIYGMESDPVVEEIVEK